MAIFYCDFAVLSRSKEQSAVGAAAYISGEVLVDGHGHVHDRSAGADRVDAKEILAPAGAPDWVRDRGELWRRAERAERRKDSQLARRCIVALPRELDARARSRLVRDWVRSQFVDRGMVADVAWHDGGSENPHAHVMLTMRRLAGEGFGPKERSWNRKQLVTEWAKSWADHANRELELAGSDERIDHRSIEAQREEAIAREDKFEAVRLSYEPGVHRGPAATALARKGVSTGALAAAERAEALRREAAEAADLLRAGANVELSPAAALAIQRVAANRGLRKAEDAVERLKATVAALQELLARGVEWLVERGGEWVPAPLGWKPAPAGGPAGAGVSVPEAPAAPDREDPRAPDVDPIPSRGAAAADDERELREAEAAERRQREEDAEREAREASARDLELEDLARRFSEPIPDQIGILTPAQIEERRRRENLRRVGRNLRRAGRKGDDRGRSGGRGR